MRFLLGATAAASLVGASACEESKRGQLFRTPSSSMEPTLHCAQPGSGCEADEEDLVRVRPDSTPERGDIVAFRVPEAGVVACGGSPGSGEFVFVNRVIGLPGEEWAEKKGYIYINGELLSEPYLEESR